LFVKHWTDPHGGIHGYLHRFLESGDSTFQHIAIWTLLQLLESEDRKLVSMIQKAADITRMVNEIAERVVESDEDSTTRVDDSGEEGDGEVVVLARRCAELLRPKLREG